MNPEEQINCLNEIKNSPSLRGEIESFITDNDFNAFDFDKNSLSQHKDFVSLEFSKRVDSWSKKYAIRRMPLILYFSLDKKLFPKINSSLKGHFVKPLEIPYGNYYRCVTGSNISFVFTSNIESLSSYLYDNVELFPYSTQDYINKKISEINNWVMIDKLANEFDYRTYKSSICNNFNIHNVQFLIKKFHKLNYFNKANSFVYLYLILLEINEEEKHQRQIDSLLTSVANSISFSIDYIFNDFDIHNYQFSHSEFKFLKLIQSKFYCNESFSKGILERVCSSRVIKNNSSLFFLYSCISKPEDFDYLDNIFLKLTSNYQLLEFNSVADIDKRNKPQLVSGFINNWNNHQSHFPINRLLKTDNE